MHTGDEWIFSEWISAVGFQRWPWWPYFQRRVQHMLIHFILFFKFIHFNFIQMIHIIFEDGYSQVLKQIILTRNMGWCSVGPLTECFGFVFLFGVNGANSRLNTVLVIVNIPMCCLEQKTMWLHNHCVFERLNATTCSSIDWSVNHSY